MLRQWNCVFAPSGAATVTPNLYRKTKVRGSIVDDKQGDIRESYGRQHLPRLFSGRVDDDKQTEIREHYLGIGVAVGSSFGVAIGAGLGVAFGNLALGIGFCISLGVGLGIVVGSILGNKHAKSVQEPTDTDGSRDA